MKVNLPVTQQEVFLEPGKPIVTKTDLKGIITYANDSFIRISGFTSEELIGASHNVVRHPDMPKEAFADLWATTKAGQPWRGFVKNRTKGGDYYWVEAFVTPIRENGNMVGYMSVRSIPDRADVAAAENLYRNVRDNKIKFPTTKPVKTINSVSRLAWAAIGVLALLLLVGEMLEGPARWVTMSLVMLGLIAAGIWMQRTLLAPLDQLGRAMDDVDEGQLAKRITPPGGPLDRLFLNIESMRIHQRAMFADVLLAAKAVAERSASLDEAIKTLEKTSGNQTERVMQVAAAMEQMSVSVSEISENTGQSLTASEATSSASASSKSAMHESISISDRVVQAVKNSQQTIVEMHQSILDIGMFASLIKEIADQTNLLALNAAIEAARAGETGRGFAVVADEVRKLAERTAKSTADIDVALKAVDSRTQSAVTSMEQAAEAVTKSTESIHGTSHSIDEISNASSTAMALAKDVRRMLQQQSDASHEVAVSMESLSSLVDQSYHTVGDIGHTMQGLRGTSTELHSLVRHLERAL